MSEGVGERPFRDGTSEIESWIAMVAIMIDPGPPGQALDHVPCYRSLARTGNVTAFFHWQADEQLAGRECGR